MPITFINEQNNFKIKNKTLIRHWILSTIKNEKKQPGHIAFFFVENEKLLKINREYLKHNTYTDIITFDYSDSDKLSGEIFISTERVNENAKKFKTTFNEELHRVIIHGILHLCGYNDKTKTETAEMRKKETHALSRLTSS